jgi:ComF family protein
MKYSARPDLARPLAELLRGVVRAAEISADCVVPVPLHANRLVHRGYNQAALLAAPVAAELGARLDVSALSRVRDTRQQAQLPRWERAHNVHGAFVARSRNVRGRCVVVVDDVVTTGATLSACVDALLAAGAASVVTVAVAKADMDGSTDGADSAASGS